MSICTNLSGWTVFQSSIFGAFVGLPCGPGLRGLHVLEHDADSRRE